MRAPASHRLLILASVVISLVACIERSDPTDPGVPKTSSVRTVAVRLPVSSLEVGHVVIAAATLMNAAGQAISSAPIQWLSSDNSILTVSSAGQVSAQKLGTAWVYATNEGVSGRVALTVTDSVPARVLISPRSTNAAVGAHVQLSASVTTTSGRMLPEHSILWTSTHTRNATVSSSGLVTGVTTGIVRIIAQAGSVADTSTVGVVAATAQPPAQTSGAGAHEPSIMTPIQDWNGHGQGAWLTADGSAIKQRFAFDSELADTVMVQTYGPWVVPTGHTYGPGHLYIPIPSPSRPVASFYLRAQLKLSANWVQPPGIGDQKLFQMFPSDGLGYNVGIILVGRNGNLRLMAYENNRDDPRYNGIPLGQNPIGSKYVTPPSDIFTLNQWHTIEVLIVGCTPGMANGRVVTWLDGKKQTEVDDMMWVSAGQDGNFSQFDLNSLWGGQGGRLTAAQYMYVGKIHISGSAQRIPDSIP